MREMPRAVVDTNIFVSALLGGENSRFVLDLFLNGKFDLVISEKLFKEFIEVVGRKKFSKIIDEKEHRKLAELIKTDADWVTPTEKISTCRDPKDNIMLECAVSGKIDFIITGDRDLLILHPFRGISILSPSQFLKYIK